MEDVLRELAVTDEGKLCNVLGELHKVVILTRLQPAGERPRVAGRGTHTSPAIGETALLIMHESLSPKF
jgi:hypothetical protein